MYKTESLKIHKFEFDIRNSFYKKCKKLGTQITKNEYLKIYKNSYFKKILFYAGLTHVTLYCLKKFLDLFRQYDLALGQILKLQKINYWQTDLNPIFRFLDLLYFFPYLPVCNEGYLPLDPRILFSKRLPFYQLENPDICPWLLGIRLQPFHTYRF